MSKLALLGPTSLVASLFVAAMFLGGCGAAVESGESDEQLGDEIADTDDQVGESEEALKYINPTGGGPAPTPGCGYFCPWWAKDLSDCLEIPCDQPVFSP